MHISKLLAAGLAYLVTTSAYPYRDVISRRSECKYPVGNCWDNNCNGDEKTLICHSLIRAHMLDVNAVMAVAGTSTSNVIKTGAMG
ncbi:hypothetical protein MGYG_07985 [Nannizzia gypsea CBS 118893]|uniref:Uncharacterized protein n=1 Tax=Arthroderma gypseum (strain ATCC MYA-4604 / CBS 118893) TaxID=535722 RepID=E4V4Q8_ARTGP|nr:hypothetical protein MGYG_07985 [Nannizzia gypsea CBS 118893]EFR04982.1 hypothetical protein MGYG_07985 [Nannizzia gypsea CBS 118893]